MPIACAACDFVNEPGTAFCGGCGAGLARATPDRSNAAAERRHVAVLFVDLVGYTRLTGELGSEDTKTLLDGFFATVDGLAERHGGTIAQHLGDCVMALFGAPVARGDDVDRAVRAGLAMLAAMPELSARVGRALQVHIGIAVGAVVAGGTGSDSHRIYTVTGEAVNLAARLADLAGPGELLVSDAIRMGLAAPAQLEDRGLTVLQGIALPVRVHRLLELGAAPTFDTGRLVGRVAELEQLLTLLGQAKVAGQGRIVLLRGDAGIGKTRLLSEARHRAEQLGFACHTALVLDFGSGEGAEVIRVLTRKLLAVDQMEPEAREQAVGLVPAESQPFVRALLDLPLSPALQGLFEAMADEDRRRARQQALRAVLEAVAARHPLLLIVEDVHWAERDTLDDLAAIGAAIAALPTLLVMATRRDGDPIDAAWHARTEPTPATTIELHPLHDADARTLALQLLTDADMLVAERCVARAQGNPLFLEQLSRHVRERGDDAVPATVQTLMQARLDRLDPDDRNALRAASVFGQRFTLPGLRALLEEPRYDPRQLVQRLLIRLVGDGFLFAHALIRDAVYDMLLRAQLRELHRRAAAFFAGLDPILHAQHLDRAGDPLAVSAYAAAARQQAEAYRNEPALELAARGLAIATSAPERLELASLVGRLQLDLGRAPAAELAFGTALEVAREPLDRCRAYLGLASTMRLGDRFDEALAHLDAAENAAASAGLTAELSRIHHVRGNLLFPLGKPEDCAREHAAALRHAQAVRSPELEARALGGVGDAEYARGRMISAHAAFRRCCELARQHGFGRIEAANLPMVGVTRWFMLDLAGIQREGDDAVDLAMRVGHLRGAIIAHHTAWMGALLRADLAEAQARAREAVALTQRIGARRFEAENLLFMAEGSMLAGDLAGARELGRQAMQASRDTAISYIGPSILGLIAWTADTEPARRAAIDEAEALLAAGSLSHNFLLFRRYAIEAAIAACDWDEVERHAGELELYTAAEPLAWTDFLAARGRALAMHHRQPADPGAHTEVQRVRDLAAKLGLLAAIPALDAALAQRSP